MDIEIEWGWVRLGDHAVWWGGPSSARMEDRLPGDPWFAWKAERPRDGSAKGSGGCWLGQLQILWEYPTREWRAAEAERLKALPARLAEEAAHREAENAARAAAASAAEAGWSSEFGIPLPTHR